MENNWLRTSKNEREDIRTFRYTVIWVFQTQSRVLQIHQESMAGNLEKKKALCEKAEALKENTDWKATADILSKLQRNGKQSVLYLKSIRMPYGNDSLPQ